jgi:septum formation protein
MKLLLASRSETRRQMLTAAAIDHEPVASPIDEDEEKASLLDSGCSPSLLAQRLAELKAMSIDAPGDALVVGADQVLETADGRMMSKPASRKDASAQLRALRGTTHRLHSSAVLVRDGKPVWSATETVTLRMRRFGDSFLERYLEEEYEAVRWNVGAYRIEGPGVQLFEAVEGSHFAILGLPLLPLLAALREQGLIPD